MFTNVCKKIIRFSFICFPSLGGTDMSKNWTDFWLLWGRIDEESRQLKQTSLWWMVTVFFLSALCVRGFDLWPPHPASLPECLISNQKHHFKLETEWTPASTDSWLYSRCPLCRSCRSSAKQMRPEMLCSRRCWPTSTSRWSADAVRHCVFISIYKCACLTLASGRFSSCVCVLRLKAPSCTRTWRPTRQRWKVSVEVCTPSKHGRHARVSSRCKTMKRRHVWVLISFRSYSHLIIGFLLPDQVLIGSVVSFVSWFSCVHKGKSEADYNIVDKSHVQGFLLNDWSDG